MTGSRFADWQPRYAEHGIFTFPSEKQEVGGEAR